MMRAQAPTLTPQQKRYLYLKAISDYNYVVRNALPTMALMPEVHYKLGELHLAMENVGLASESFNRSRNLKPDYWPSYTRWADVLASLKRYDDALALVREGLRHAPDNNELLKRAAKFEAAGGRAAPLGKVAAVSPPAAPAPAKAGADNAKAPGAMTSPPAASPAPSPAASPAPAPAPASPPSEAEAPK
jgi:tetratricopeptide (TPR) repeat protein